MSEPVKPIVFHLDRAIPEPMRSAARRGILWWNAAFEQAGFKAFERSPIELRVNDRSRVDVSLEVGQLTDRVTVLAEAPLLELSIVW